MDEITAARPAKKKTVALADSERCKRKSVVRVGGLQADLGDGLPDQGVAELTHRRCDVERHSTNCDSRDDGLGDVVPRVAVLVDDRF